MTVERIINELKSFYNLYYCFEYNYKEHRAILGDKNCRFKDRYDDTSNIEYYFKHIEWLSLQESLTVSDKKSLGDYIQKLMIECNYRHSDFITLQDQQKYLEQFDEKAWNIIYDQICMYKAAIQYL